MPSTINFLWLTFALQFEKIYIMIEYTPEQQKAIDCTGSLIVSASAGSGKTTVMIQRILRLLRQGVPIKGFFVSTFTKASAQDMQSKLKDKLHELASEDAQMLQLADSVNEASIGTFHSLCAKFVRAYFYAANVDPDFVLMDEQESKLILHESIKKVLDKAHEAPTDSFLNLYNVTLQNRTDKALQEQIVKVYLYCKAQVDWQEWLDNASKCHEYPDECVSWYSDIVESKLSHLKSVLNDFFEKTSKMGMNFGLYVNELLQLLDGSQAPLTSLSKIKCNVDKGIGEHLDKYEEFKKIKKHVQSVCEKFSQTLVDPRLACDILNQLLQLVQQSCVEYDRAKAEIAKLDFSDLEHCMLKVLQNPQTRRQLTSSISHMFVDEYQDINPLQDKVLTILGEQAEVFVVGDVKQSIYSFRMCDPRFFVKKMQAESLVQNNMQLINLNGNFRSHQKILEFVNSVFAPIMTVSSGGSNYAQESMLRGGNIFEQTNLPSVVCKIVHSQKSTCSDVLPPYDILQHVNKVDGNAAEIEVVVRHVADLVLNHKVDFGDIAILTHSRDKFSFELCNALNDLGFDTLLEQKKTVLDSLECSSLLAFLSLVDFVKNDIALVGVLRSGFCGLGDVELAQIRASFVDGYSFFDCCNSYVKHNDDSIAKHLKLLFDKIEHYQSLKNSLTVSQLAYTIVAQHDFLFSLYKNPSSSQVLFWFLEDIEKHPYQHDLCRYLQSVHDNVPNLRQSEQTGCINIVTVHASKGLEYDYVILPNLDRHFNKDYSRQKFLLDSKLGIASKYFDVENGKTHSNATFEYFRHSIECNARSEEMRLLYVALTRAKKQIFLTIDSSASDFKKGDNVTKWSDWLYPVVQQKSLGCNCFFNDGWQKLNDQSLKTDFATYRDDFGKSQSWISDVSQDDSSASDVSLGGNTTLFGKPDVHLLELIKSNVEISWKNIAHTTKSSVTRLLKTEESEPVLYEDDKGVELGTAYHKVLQCIDLELPFALAFKNLEPTIAVYKDRGLDLQVGVLQKAHGMLQRLLKGRKVYRERPFMLNATKFCLNDPISGEQVLASQFYGTDLIQGIIDVVALKGESAIVVDYKTSINKSNFESYNRQLQLYRIALSNILGFKEIETFLYDITKSKLHRGVEM